jgi:hypothetical protein
MARGSLATALQSTPSERWIGNDPEPKGGDDMQTGTTVAILLALAAGHGASVAMAQAPRGQPTLERGRYVAVIAGCNDCHTEGFAPSGGKVPEKEWFKGDRMGWRGPWGTTYGPNLRLYMQKLSEDDWVKTAKTLQARPPMPWWALHAMDVADLRSLYRFVRSLGDPGTPAPAYLPPERKPPPPYVELVVPPSQQKK